MHLYTHAAGSCPSRAIAGYFHTERVSLIESLTFDILLRKWLIISISTLAITVVKLEQDNVQRSDVGLCGKSVSYRPYSTIGSVQESSCLGFNCVDSNLGPLIVGWGCDEEWTKETAGDIKERCDAYSDRNYIQLADEIAARTRRVLDKMDVIERHLETYPQIMTMKER
jgi:hypothetical protein